MAYCNGVDSLSDQNDQLLVFVALSTNTSRDLQAGGPGSIVVGGRGLSENIAQNLNPFVIATLVILRPEALHTRLSHCSEAVSTPLADCRRRITG